MSSSFDDQVRWQVYDITMREGQPPLRKRVSEEMRVPPDDVSAAFERLAKRRMLVLQPGNGEILMAGPFSAVPTPFRVMLRQFSAYGNCVWDALGIAATMRSDAEVETSCADCGAAALFSVAGGEVHGEGFMHFALPPRTWWDNIVFT